MSSLSLSCLVVRRGRVLDIEGAELVALQGMDFSAVSVSVVLVESPRSGPRPAVDYLSTRLNYTCVPFKHNHACHAPSFTPSMSVKSSLHTTHKKV
jgi:hypothetical protein